MALGYINNHSGSEASLEHLAAYAKTSISNLRTIFKKEMGISPGAFVTAHRLKVAKYNLAMTSIRINELADVCGFQSVYALSHFFKKNVGMSPLAWRKKNQQGANIRNKTEDRLGSVHFHKREKVRF